MRISKIETKDFIYHVTFEPNWIEGIFGVKPKTERYRASDSRYVFGGGTVYIREDGEKCGNHSYVGDAIDKWRRKF